MRNILLIINALWDLLTQYAPIQLRRQNGFAFLVHPRDEEDIFIKYPFLKFLSPPLRGWLLERLWPVVLSPIEGMRDRDGLPIPGWVLTLALPPTYILKHKDIAMRKIIQAMRLAKKLGAEIFGLGAFTSSITRAGSLLPHPILPIASGHTYTALITTRSVCALMEEQRLRGERVCIALVGATGSIGNAVSRLLAHSGGFDSLTLIGRTPKHMELLFAALVEYDMSHIKTSFSLEDIKDATIIIIATSAAESLIQLAHIKKGATVYDITQPKNINLKHLRELRPDIRYIDGGLVSIPSSIHLNFNFRLPPHTAFACLAETMLIAAGNLRGDFSGPVSLTNIALLEQTAMTFGFVPHMHTSSPPAHGSF